MNGTLDVGNSVNGASLIVTNYLVLNGTALVGNPTNGWYGAITFAGSQLLGGSGTVVFGNYGNPAANALRLANDGATLVIGSGITVRGQNGTVGYSAVVWRAAGRIGLQPRDDFGGCERGDDLWWRRSPSTIRGQLQSPAGTLDLAGTIASGGLGSVQSGNGVLGLSGFLTNDNQTIILAGTSTRFDAAVRRDDSRGRGRGDQWELAERFPAGTLDGVTVDGTLDVGNTYNGANLTVTNGLTLNGTATGGQSYQQLVWCNHLYGEPTLGRQRNGGFWELWQPRRQHAPSGERRRNFGDWFRDYGAGAERNGGIQSRGMAGRRMCRCSTRGPSRRM